MTQYCDVAVIGGGVIGLSVGLGLLAAGRDVLIVDDARQKMRASAGNAGVIANYACTPLGTPPLMRALPSLMLGQSSPLSVHWRDLPKLTPWGARFAMSSTASRVRQTARALNLLLSEALDAHRELLSQVGAEHLLNCRGALHIFRSKDGRAVSDFEFAERAAQNIAQQKLDRSEIEAIEPALPAEFTRGIFFPEAAHISDPGALISCLEEFFLAKGGRFHRTNVTHLIPNIRSVILSDRGEAIQARHVILCAGAWSASLAAQLGDRIPLAIERGYHLEFPTAMPPTSRPICSPALGFYLTPMNGRMRAAGTVEFAAMNRPASQARLALIEAGARTILPDLGPRSSSWLGFRPSLPDSKPVIGRSRATDRVLYAFGHGHLGLTLAAITARHVIAMLNGRVDPALDSFAPSRFRTALP